MANQIDLSGFTAEQLAALKAQLNSTDGSGRSPIKPRQLHDLRLLPTADDPRPTFFWSVDPPRDGRDLTRGTPYPRLLWHVDSGEEITVLDLEAHQAKQAEGCWTETAPSAGPVDPMADMQAALDALTPEDRALVVAAQQQTRLQEITAKLSKLSPSTLELLLTAAKDEATGKRGPGRPKKIA